MAGAARPGYGASMDEALIVPTRADGDDPAAEEVVGSPVPAGDPTPLLPAAGVPVGTPVGTPVGGPVGAPEPGDKNGRPAGGGPAPASPSRWVLGAATVVVLLVSLAGWWLLAARERALTEALFFDALARATTPTAVLSQADATPSWLRGDPRVEAIFAAARAALAGEHVRRSAARELGRLAGVASLEEWRAVCDRAAALDPTWAEPLALRAQATLALARGQVSAAGPPPRFDVVAAEADRELAQALALEPARAAELLVRRARLLLAAPGDADARRRAAARVVAQALDLAADSGPGLPLAQAQRLALQGEWQGAGAHADRAAAAAPGSVEARLLQAEARLRTGHHAEAAALAQALLADAPWSGDAAALEVEARLALGARGVTSYAVDRALTVDPDHPRALAARAYLGLQRDAAGLVTSPARGREAAREAAERALRLDPAQPLAHAVLAELGDAAGALVAAGSAVEHGAHLPDVHVLRGRLRGRQGDLGALDDFEQALRLRPADARALANRAGLLLARGRVPEALAAADEALRVDPNLAEAYLQRARAHLKAPPRDRQRAYDDLNHALRRAPGLVEAWLHRAAVFHDLAMHAEAVADVDRALALLAPGAARRADLLLVRGRSLLGLARWVEAEAALAEVERQGRTSHRDEERLHLLRERLAGRLDDAALREALAATR